MSGSARGDPPVRSPMSRRRLKRCSTTAYKENADRTRYASGLGRSDTLWSSLRLTLADFGFDSSSKGGAAWPLRTRYGSKAGHEFLHGTFSMVGIPEIEAPQPVGGARRTARGAVRRGAPAPAPEPDFAECEAPSRSEAKPRSQFIPCRKAPELGVLCAKRIHLPVPREASPEQASGTTRAAVRRHLCFGKSQKSNLRLVYRREAIHVATDGLRYA